MMKIRVSIFLFVCFLQVGNLFAQSADSVVVLKAKWEKKKIARGAKLMTYHFTDSSLFNANQFISYLEIKNRGKHVSVSVGADPKVLYTTSDFALKNNAIGAINGTFFDIKNGGSVDYIRSGGQVVNVNRVETNGKRNRHQQAAVVMDNGGLEIVKWDGSADWETKLTAPEIMLSGPMLLSNQTYEPLDSTSFTRARHPRTVVGKKADGTILLLTVDGRQQNSAGMSLPELASLMKWLGSVEAINLDGGGSTTLWVGGATENGVVNYPSDNKKWDHEGQRKVANVLLLKAKPRIKR